MNAIAARIPSAIRVAVARRSRACPCDARLMRRLVTYVLPYKRMVLGAICLIVLSSLLQLVGPLATAVALDLFVRPFDE